MGVFGRSHSGGRQFLGLPKASKLGLGKTNSTKSQPAPPPLPFDRPELAKGVANYAALMSR